jgi:hypothetical protein
MINVTVIVREVGGLNPVCSLNFIFPVIPRIGEYISIQRSEKLKPLGEDMVVRKVWWRLSHPETSSFPTADKPRSIGNVDEVFVECAPAISPYSSDSWRTSVESSAEIGESEFFEVARTTIRESDQDISGL